MGTAVCNHVPGCHCVSYGHISCSLSLASSAVQIMSPLLLGDIYKGNLTASVSFHFKVIHLKKKAYLMVSISQYKYYSFSQRY